VRVSAASAADRFLPKRIATRARPALEQVDRAFFTPGGRGHAGRTSLTAFLIRVASAAIALVSQVLLARWMGGFEYGIFVLVWTTMLILGDLSCLGFNTSIVRYIPEYRERRQLAQLRGVMAASRLIVLVLSTLIAAAGICFVWLVSPYIESFYVIPFCLGIVCLPMLALSDTLEGIARANNWAIRALAPVYLLRPVLILAMMMVALAAGFPADARTALVAAIVATYATTLYQILSITPRTATEVKGVVPQYHLRNWIVVSLPILFVEGFFFLLTNADVLMVGYFMQPTDVAVYFATVKTIALVHFVYFAVKAGAAQRYAEYAHSDDTGRLAEFARSTATWTFWPSLVLALGLLAIGKPLLSLFGPGFDAGYPLLYVLLLGVIARASVGPAESLLTMSGHQNVCAAIYAATLAVNVVLNVALIPTLGLLGAALATGVAMMCEAVLLAFTVWRRLGIVMFVFAPTGAR
jgi:O-antigen/teichoic acid export membrane protein